MDADLSHNQSTYRNSLIRLDLGMTLLLHLDIFQWWHPDWPLHRRILSRYGNFYARLFLGNKISDYTGGYNMYTTDLLTKIDLNSIDSTGYVFLIEVKVQSSTKL